MDLANIIGQLREHLNEQPCCDITELRLSYTCSTCRTEFIFNAEIRIGTIEKKASFANCPVCGEELSMAGRDSSEILLWKAVKLYKDLCELVTTHKELQLKLCQSKPTGLKGE